MGMAGAIRGFDISKNRRHVDIFLENSIED
jgi:hypothetical protein